MAYDEASAEYERLTVNRRRRSGSVMPVRMLMAKVAWLDGFHRWRNGQVHWEVEPAPLAPGPSDLARCQRSLNKLQQYPIATRQVMGNPSQWLQHRQSRLELAKLLLRATSAELHFLKDNHCSGEPFSATTVSALLAAEALCVNTLPLSPARLLVVGAPKTLPVLTQVVMDESLPQEVRAFAALVSGAVARASRRNDHGARRLPIDPWLRRAERWGRNYGVGDTPALVAALLAQDEACAHRVLASIGPRFAFALEPELLRELLAKGTPPAQVAELAEAGAAFEAVAERLLDHRHLLPQSRKERKAAAANLDLYAAETIETLRHLLEEYSRATGEPDVLQAAASLTHFLLDLGSGSRHAVAAIIQCLQTGQRLPAELRRDWLRLLRDNTEAFWRDDSDSTDTHHCPVEVRLERRLDLAWHQMVSPSADLLMRYRCAAFIREALPLGCLDLLATLSELDLETQQLMVWTAYQFPRFDRTLLSNVGAVASRYPRGTVARAALEPLFTAVSRTSNDERTYLLSDMFAELRWSERNEPGLPSSLARLVPLLLSFHPWGLHWSYSWSVTSAALKVHREQPSLAVPWLTALFNAANQWVRDNPALLVRLNGLDDAVRVGLGISGENLEAFLSATRISLSITTHHEHHSLSQGYECLAKFPEFRATITSLFAMQPHRCLDLILRLGLSNRLDPTIQSHLALWIDAPEELHLSEEEDDWRAVLDWAPELHSVLASLRSHLRLCNRPLQLPVGVLRALRLPDRLSGELSYLEALPAHPESSPHIQARISNLRTRLTDLEGLRKAICSEMEERLAAAVSEARLLAATKQVDACFLRRLEQVAGPLPEDLVIDEDWMNAALLSAGIQQNRNLLRRLLRGCLDGNRNWPEHHPENQRFLHSLSSRGVNAQAWLEKRPRRYACEAAVGGWAHLWLEQDPLRVMQMGNFFDTCLANDGCNSFSSVANACELNKRVLYASDGEGRVVGRKLIAINEEGEMVGFHTYTSLSTREANVELTAIVTDYLFHFARECGLRLGHRGPVPRLFAEAWYDDGIVDWDEPAKFGRRMTGSEAGLNRTARTPPEGIANPLPLRGDGS